MEPKQKKEKRSTSSETASPSHSKMNPKKKKQKLSKSEIAGPMDLNKKKKKQKVSKSIVVASPSQSKTIVQEVMNDVVLSKKELRESMKKQNDAAMFLTGKVISTVAKNSNFVFSPASINAVLTMVAASSSEEEETLRSFIFSFLKSSSIEELAAVFREIATVVLVDRSKRGGPKIGAVNGVWIEKSISVNPLLKDLFEKFFNASLHRVDFRSKGEQVRHEVNSWALDHTKGLIKSLLPPNSVNRDTNYIYGNALYFKGTWQSKFHKSCTSDQEFHLLNGTSVSVPFMSSSKDKYVKAFDGYKVLKLPFRHGGDDRGFSMYFYLPDKKYGLDGLVKTMASTRGFLDSHIPINKVKIGEFKIPKFKIQFGFEASKVFDDLELDVSLYHKAWVEIDEDGAEAASFTAIRKPYAGCCRGIDFVADHPFLFLIREDKTGTVLFVGQVVDPSEST